MVRTTQTTHMLLKFTLHCHMRFYVTQWSATRFSGSLSVYNRPFHFPKNRPLAAQSNSPVGDSPSCLMRNSSLQTLIKI